MPVIGMPDGTQVQFPDDMPDEQIRGLISQKFPDAVKSIQSQPKQQAATTLLDYPRIYSEMVGESTGQIGRGVEQLKSGFQFATTPTPEGMSRADQAGAGPVNLVKGAGNVALGSLGYVGAPIAAGLRTLVGNPLQERVGIPREYTEFAAGAALPIPRRISVPSRSPAKPAPMTSENLLDKADEGYAAARSNKFTIATPDEIKALKNDIIADLQEAGYRPITAGRTFGLLDELKTEAPSHAADIISVRTALNRVTKNHEESDAARRAIEKLDEYLEPRVPEIKDARGNYAAGRRLEMVEDEANLARIKSESPTGPTISTALSARARAILSNKNKRRGLSDDEIAQLEAINKGTFAGNAAGYIEGLLKGTGSMKTILPVATGGMAPLGAKGLSMIGGALKKNQYAQLQEMIAARSPAGRAAEASVNQWSEAARAFDADPSVKAFAKLSIMSRNLSNTLGSAGIHVEPNSLIRSLQGAMHGGAEEEQPDPIGIINQ